MTTNFSATKDNSRDLRIELRLSKLDQLFNSLDLSPFLERDLDDDAEEYIVDWARELPADMPIRIVVHVPEEESIKARAAGIEAAINHYFDYRAKAARSDLRELFRNGRRYLAIGFPILVICLFTSHWLRANFGEGPLSRTIEESLILVGWVANWKPIQTFLYDWWPVKRRRDLYRRLAKANCEITG
jgi:hypothetical protein